MAQMSNRTARARAAMELKLSILSALNKLGDRDTQQMAVEELQRIAEGLSPEGITVFLTCIFDVGAEQKVPVRKECVKIMAALSTIHGENLSPHASKIVGYVMRKLRESDSQIRDACVDTMGVLVARVPPLAESNSTGGGNFLTLYTKPLFDSMGEQTKIVQVGASMCLGKVIENAPNLTPACIHRLAQRIVKVLSGPGFMAKAALLSAVGSLSRVAKDTGDDSLIQLVPCVQEALHSNDWTARKAAAETLSVLANPGLSKMKPSTLGVLDTYRFDKVKPVRDAVSCAIQVWKTVPGPEVDNSPRLKSSSIPPPEETPSFSRCWNVSDGPEPDSPETPAPLENAESVLSDDKSSTKTTSSRKKAPVIGDLKMNPEFFRKLESKIEDDWEVEVVAPRASPTQGEADDNSSRRTRTPPETETGVTDPICSPGVGNASVQPSAKTIKASLEETACWLEEAVRERKEEHPKQQQQQRGQQNQHPQQQEQQKQQEQQQQRGGAPSTRNSIHGSDWILIQRQISQLQRGQTELLEMIQDFMCTCQESMLSLQDRVQRLERSVETLEKVPPGRSSGGGAAGSNGRNVTSFEFLSRNRGSKDPESFGSSFFKASDFEERFSVQSDRSGRESPYGGSQELRSGMHFEGHLNGPRRSGGIPGSSSLLFGGGSRQQQQQLEEEDQVEEIAPVTRRAWDRIARHGEGPSARSVWRASKDEATLEAIRGAADEEMPGFPDAEKAEMLPEKEVESKQPAPSWLFWTRAMENLHGGDVDAAYEEALSAEDDLLLVRMMNQTGPAFDHFSSSTAISMFRAIIQILHQQHFLDAAFPWLEQVAELARSKGADCFKFSMEAKREVVSSLHEASALDFPERWMGNNVAKLALQLATVWSIDLLDQVVIYPGVTRTRTRR